MRISDWSSDVCSSDLQQKVLGDKRIQRRNVVKTYFLLFLYLGLYACILLFGNSTPLLFLCYIFLGFSMIMLFINAFHDAAHGSVLDRKSVASGRSVSVRVGLVGGRIIKNKKKN